MKTSFPEARARYTHAPDVHLLEGWQSITTEWEKNSEKNKLAKPPGKKTWYIIREEICHKHIPPPRLISSYFNTGEGCMCLRCCDAAPKHHTKTEFRRHSVTGVVNTTNLITKALCVWGYYNVIRMWMLLVVSCSPNQRTFDAATLKMTDVSPLLRLFNWGWWSNHVLPTQIIIRQKELMVPGLISLFKSNLALLISLRCTKKSPEKQFFVQNPTFIEPLTEQAGSSCRRGAKQRVFLEILW